MAERLPSGKYRVLVRYEDEYGATKRKSFTAETEVKAEILAEKFREERFNIVFNKTVKKAIEEYIASNEAILSPSTIRGYKAYFRSSYQTIESVHVQDLTTHKLQQWMNDLAATKSPKTCRNAWELLQSAVKAADSTLPTIKLPHKKRRYVDIPQRRDVDNLLNWSKGTSLYPCILLGAHLGLRRSEMSALTWDDFDFDNRLVEVNKAKVRGDYGYVVKEPKSEAGYRRLDMSDAVFNYFSTADKSVPPVQLSPEKITEHFHTLCKKHNVDFHIHLLRHYYASVCCAQGIPEAYTVLLMGHSTFDMVKKVYGHVLNEAELLARQKVVEYFNVAHEVTHDGT